jgi:hypothetical protein
MEIQDFNVKISSDHAVMSAEIKIKEYNHLSEIRQKPEKRPKLKTTSFPQKEIRERLKNLSY